jgi:hypothetical protein
MLAMELRESKVCALLRVRGIQSMPAAAAEEENAQQMTHNRNKAATRLSAACFLEAEAGCINCPVSERTP